jgi:hypothetical protein
MNQTLLTKNENIFTNDVETGARMDHGISKKTLTDVFGLRTTVHPGFTFYDVL